MSETKIDVAVNVGNLLGVNIEYSTGSTVCKNSWNNVLIALVMRDIANKEDVAKAVGTLLGIDVSVSSEGTVPKESWENVYFEIKNRI